MTVAIVALSCNKTQVADSEENSQELPLSIQLCLSEMQRTPHAVNLDFRTKPKWNYSTGVELYAMLKAAGKYNNQKVFEYVY
ncbi:MAG: glycosyl hydrolase family 88, partial [Bacteroidales bacterium]|nr:glycosyl hydrolase family 88 [Bacteroidales bacterium]